MVYRSTSGFHKIVKRDEPNFYSMLILEVPTMGSTAERRRIWRMMTGDITFLAGSEKLVVASGNAETAPVQ